MMLGRTGHFDEAQRQLEESLRADPGFADAHVLLGDLLMARQQVHEAAPHYREALRITPESSRAHLGLGAALRAAGDLEDAISHLKRAAAGADPAIREQAAEMLRQIESRR
jgi:tetratricopeptide (TPR) repeat protein